MNVKLTEANVAVVVARFQTPYLTEGHIDLLNWVVENHRKVVVFLGMAPTKVTRNNPLDFESRKQMILESYPDVTVLYIKDNRSDEIWSKNLDAAISDLSNPFDKVMLYGSRDSFIKHYTGRYPTTEMEGNKVISATEVREKIAKAVTRSSDFRAGVVWAAFNQFPISFPTVDFTVVRQVSGDFQILLGRKPGETKFRFGGGFVDVTDNGLEAAARRELKEEFGDIDVGPATYISSRKIDDWRYRGSGNGIVSTLFAFLYNFGSPKASDDIEEVKWFSLKDLQRSDIIEEHADFLSDLKGHKEIL